MTAPSQDELLARLAVAEQTLDAIARGEVDGLMVTVDGVPRIFTLEGADTFYRILVEQMPEGAAAVNADGTVVYANSTLAAMLGVPPEALVATDLLQHVAAGDVGRLRSVLLQPASDPSRELVLCRADGTPVPVALSVRAVDGAADGVRCVVAVDLTGRHRAEAALRAAEGRFRGAFDDAPIGMALLDPDGCAEQVNPALCGLAGRTGSELLGRRLPWLDDAAGAQLLRSVQTGRHDSLSVEARGATPEGASFVTVHLRSLRSAGTPSHVIAQVQDDSERHRHEIALRQIADHDGLTGLLNRRAFDQELDDRLELSRRLGTGGALLLIDVDHFKYVNDTRGHRVGDQVLTQLARALRQALRESDVLARLGGDEFAVLLPTGDAQAAALVAEHLLAAARSVVVDELGSSRPLTLSIGLTALADATGTAGELMAMADLAMYDSKEDGRDRVTVFRPDHGGAHTTRLTWLARIEQALAAGALLLDAQPIVDLATGRTVQSELLVRLPSDTGRVPAVEWFPTAERCGLAPAVDEWVVDRAVALLAEDRFDRVNVNVSATSIARPSWQTHVQQALARTRLDASRLTFEITETAAIGNIPAAVAFTERLRALGCRLALDDFGAGFASFYYLKHLPFDDVKIDGEFVRDCLRDERDRAIIRAMVDVAGSMGRTTVAECIEDAETLALVREQRVDRAQGFFLGAPVPVD